MKKKITIAFATQKGGCTKSTTTMIVANIFHYMFEKKVVVIDFDNQSSILETRREDFELIKKFPPLANAFTQQGIRPFEIIPEDPLGTDRLSVEEIVSVIDDDTDFIFFDYPGIRTSRVQKTIDYETNETAERQAEKSFIENHPILKDYKKMDAIFVPLTFSDLDNRSTISFLLDLNMRYGVEPKVFSIFHTKVDRQIPNWKKMVEESSGVFRDLGRDVFATYIPNLKIFNSGLTMDGVNKQKFDCLRNTILCPNKGDLIRSNYLEFAQELLDKVEAKF